MPARRSSRSFRPRAPAVVQMEAAAAAAGLAPAASLGRGGRSPHVPQPHVLRLLWRLDLALFSWVLGHHGPRPAVLRWACWTARWAAWPLVAVLALYAGLQPQRWLELLVALVTAGLTQWVGKRLAHRWNRARPFALGLCANALQHSARGGFPSAHALVMGALAGFCWFWLPPWWLAAVLALVAATAWARVYAGAHFPFDVLAGTAAGALVGGGVAVWVLPLLGLGH